MESQTNGEMNLEVMLQSLEVEVNPDDYCFATVSGEYSDFSEHSSDILMSFRESEGFTLILKKSAADSTGISYTGTYRFLTIKVHSSLEAVGLTAFISKALADALIPANVVAAFYHDHIFVPSDMATRAKDILLQKAAAISSA